MGHGLSGDPVLAMHHIVVCMLMDAFSFWSVPGVRIMALQTPIVEAGTCSYCAWVVWRNKRQYHWLMHPSNIAMFVGSTCVVYLAESRTLVIWFLYMQGVG